MTAMVFLEGITKTYHLGAIDVLAIAQIDLSIDAGEYVAIMGASGSGKSTLMNIIGCLDRPTSGFPRYQRCCPDKAHHSHGGWSHCRAE